MPQGCGGRLCLLWMESLVPCVSIVCAGPGLFFDMYLAAREDFLCNMYQDNYHPRNGSPVKLPSAHRTVIWDKNT